MVAVQRFVLGALALAVALASTDAAARLRRLGPDQFKDAMLQRVNQERRQHGLDPLCYNAKLQRASQAHTEDQADHDDISHQGSDGTSLGDRISRAQFSWSAVGENVAAGQQDVDAVVDSWMDSDGHRANLLGDFKYFGFGYAYTPSGSFHHYWTQDFAASGDEQCEHEEQEPEHPATVAPPPGPGPEPEPKPKTQQKPTQGDQKPVQKPTAGPAQTQTPPPPKPATQSPAQQHPTVKPTLAPTVKPTPAPTQQQKQQQQQVPSTEPKKCDAN